tara:strand:- start:1394 stop:1855 length:462 start_codon:yes stop_codon:yes gene_type:complete
MARTNVSSKPTRPAVSRQSKAGLTLSVARVMRDLKTCKKAKRVSDKAPLYVAGAMEFVADRVLERAVENAKAKNAKRVLNVDVIQAVRTDPDLARLFSGFAFASHAPPAKPVSFILSSKEQEKRRDAKELRKAQKAEAEQEHAENGQSNELDD